jgi:hypothetical protein
MGCTLVALLLSSPAAVSQPPQCEIALRRVVSLEYPWFARTASLEGIVELVSTIAPDGSVTKVRSTSGPEPLAKPARDVVSKWRFSGCASCRDDREARLIFRFALNGWCNASEHCPTEFEVNLPGEVNVTSKGIAAIIN